MVVFSQIIGAIGYGEYFPWAIPGLYSGISGVAMNLSLTNIIIVMVTSITGVMATFTFWNDSEHLGGIH